MAVVSSKRDTAQVIADGGLRYSQVWEDHALLEAALAISPADDILSITSAGDNVLALLLQGPRRITALDCNPAQNALLELKLAAIRHLDHAAFVRLLGVVAGEDRLRLYEAIRPGLSRSAQTFWDGQAAALSAGVIDAGRLERYMRGFHLRVLAPLAPAIGRLLAAPSLDAQRELFDAEIARPELVQAFAAYFGRQELARDGRSPEQFRFVDELDVAGALWQRFRYACRDLPARGNFYLEYALTCRYGDLEQGPPYLRPANYPRLKELASRVELVTDDLGAFLRGCPAGAFDKANLSDVFEYVSETDTEALMVQLARALRPGGRFAFWNLLVPRSSTPRVQRWLRPQHAPADALWRRDRSWFYSAFRIEQVVAPPAPDAREEAGATPGGQA
ncbi:MAG TPA: DUF3419 family protein [Polyangia bacterium]|jgi:S-adenosylmethionine-diacylglycerol 3-amino-3-carboxypropyl transferase